MYVPYGNFYSCNKEIQFNSIYSYSCRPMNPLNCLIIPYGIISNKRALANFQKGARL